MNVYWIWLSLIPYVGPVLQKRLLQTFQTPENVYQASEIELYTVDRISQRAVQSILMHRSLNRAKQVLNDLEQTSTQLLTMDSPLYHEAAKDCPQSPIVLYYRGTLRPIEEAVTIVGTRRCTDYGKTITKDLATQLASANIPVISGLAKGVDSYAHTACLQTGGYTMAVVANGVDICYPKEHRSLYEQIIHHGAVISQYPPRTKPGPKQFLQRNALMSAWSTHIVIMEAGKKSGALTTADFAKKHERKLYAVPHRIDVPEGQGTNQLLGEGVAPYLDFSSLQLTQTETKTTPEEKTNEESDILSLLQREALPFPILADRLDMDQATLTEELFALELEGKVVTRGEMVTKN